MATCLACRSGYQEHGGIAGGPSAILDALAFGFDAAAMAVQMANALQDHRDQPVTLAAVREGLDIDHRRRA